MRVGVLGMGGVGQTLAAKIASLGHEVLMGTRDVQAGLARTEAGWGAIPLSEWSAQHPDVKLGAFPRRPRTPRSSSMPRPGWGRWTCSERPGRRTWRARH